MIYRPVPSIEIFAEALAVPPFIHAANVKRVLTVGPYALPLAKLALRYPDVEDVFMVDLDEALVPHDKRVKTFASLKDLPSDWQADVVALADRGDIPTLAANMSERAAKGAVVSLAVDVFSNGRVYKDSIQRTWPFVLPYREFTPEPALFFLMSKHRLTGPVRPFPVKLKRLTPRYLSNLFTLAKEEYALLFGSPTS